MKLEVTIKYICDNPRKYQARDEQGYPAVDKDGQPVWKYIYKVYVELTNTDESFVVDAFRTREELENRGIKPGYKGTMTIHFEAKKSKDGGLFQSIRMDRFQLNNAGIFNENPSAASGAPAQSSETQAEAPAAAHEGEVNPETGLPF